MARFVQVALPVPLFKTFTYAVPEEYTRMAQCGVRVSVPFGKRVMTGVVVDEADQTEVEGVRLLNDVLDTEPLFSESMLQFAEWLSDYYLSPLGETLRSMLPQGMSPESTQRILPAHAEIADHIPALRMTAPRQAAILVALTDYPKGMAMSTLRKKVGGEHLHSQLVALEEKGLIVRAEHVKKASSPKSVRGARIAPRLLASEEKVRVLMDELDTAAPKQAAIMLALYSESVRNGNAYLPVADILQRTKASASALTALEGKGAVEIAAIEVSREEILDAGFEEIGESTLDAEPTAMVHNPDQEEAIAKIQGAIGGGFTTFLLHGVTGSGKTHVYIEAMRCAVEQGKRGILLVPEIALTLQLVERFVGVFGERVVVLHSKMSDGERYDSWRRAAAGGCDVVIGARSALFAPVRDVGVIVVDEEHESSYKQYDAQPRYNARDAAIVRAQIEGAVAVLGSATPSVESFYNAQRGKYQLLRLPRRVDSAHPPQIVVVDTHTARKQGLMRGAFSVQLLKDIQERLAKKEGVILFQNRRGFATRVECTSCGHSPMCPNCSVTLTYHKFKDELRCHYCGYTRKTEKQCELCGNHDLRQPGVGTQRVEEELAEHLPGAVIQRMDLDTTSRKGAYRKMLGAFAKGEIDILLGTQMVAKGLDFSRVSLVGVISADTQLLLPDFRASERTFQLLTQVSGRAGRRSNVKGEVVIQTGNPSHLAITAAVSNDYLMMYNDEMAHRKGLLYPPFARFILVEFRSAKQKEAEQHARIFRGLLPARHPALQILGPTEALIAKLRSQHRYQIFVKDVKAADPAGKEFVKVFAKAHDTYRKEHGKNSVQVIVDVDAQGQM